MATALESRSHPGNPTNGKSQPVWDIARFYPLQGDWTEEDFLELEATIGNRMIE
jgi:hypothetical protein